MEIKDTFNTNIETQTEARPRAKKLTMRVVAASIAVALFVLTVGNAMLSYNNLRTLTGTEHETGEASETIATLESTLSTLKDLETGAHGYVITGADDFLEPYEAGRKRIGANLQHLNELLANDPAQQKCLVTLKEKIGAKLSSIDTTIRMRREQGFEAAAAYIATRYGKNAMDEVRACVAEMQQAESATFKQRAEESAAAEHRAILSLAVAALMNLGLLGLACYFVRRDVISRRQVETKRAQLLAKEMSAREQVESDLAERNELLQKLNESERLVKRIADTSPCLLYIYDLVEHRNLYINAQSIQMLGYTAEEVNAMGADSTARLLNEDDMPQVLAHQEKLRRAVDGEIVTMEYRVRHASGEWMNFFNYETVFKRDADGVPCQILGAAQDITARKKMEENLRCAYEEMEQRVGQRTIQLSSVNQSLREQIAERHVVEQELTAERELLQVLMDNTHDLIYFKDLQSRYTRINRAFADALGINDERDAIGRTAADFFSPEQGEEAVAQDQAIIHTHCSLLDKSTTVNYADGREYWLSTAKSPIFDGDGNVCGIVGIERDVTERVRAEDQLRAANQLLHAVFQATPLAIYVLDGDGSVQMWNPAAEKTFGWSAEEVIGKYLPFVSLEKLDESRALLRSVLSGQISYFEVPRYKKDGTMIDITVSSAPLYDTHGNVTGAVAVSADITEQKRAARTLAESEKQHRELFENSLGLICTHDLDGRLLSVNPAAADSLGYEPSELIGRHGEVIIAPNYRHLFKRYLDRIRERKSDTGFIIVMTRNGEERVWEYKNSLHQKDGESPYVVGHAHDVTERRRVEVALAEARDAALESVRLKSEFLANMSHEIRTPMNGVIGMTDLLLETNLNELQREFAATIRTSADALLIIIDDILDFSKIEAGKLHFETIDFELRAVVESAVELLATRAQAKGIEIASLVYSDVPTDLRGDSGRLRQILINLIGNAVKFTERGEVVVRGMKETETDSHVTVRFSIADTGIGIAEEAKAKLFQPFMQADGSTTRKYGGTGLGLTIAKQLVEMMGGCIGVESEPGRGSTFWFTVKLEKQLTVNAPILARHTLENLRVLIVDDNETNRKLMRHQTMSWGMNVSEAASGAGALEILRAAARNNAPFDVALLDLQMPGMNGFDLARAIKTDKTIAAVRLVLLPSFGHRGHGKEARSIGIDAYLTKPVRQKQLFECLSIVTGKELRADDREAMDGTHAKGARVLVTKHSLREMRSKAQMPTCRILIAEDNVVNQRVALHQIEHFGYDAKIVSNGREVLTALEREYFDIILMDCQMPEMDGYEATAEIRRREMTMNNGNGHRTIIIAMTAHALQGDRERCLAAGMDDYISKPVKTKELRCILQKWGASPTKSKENANKTKAEHSHHNDANENGKQADALPHEVIDVSVLDSYRAFEDESNPRLVADLIDIFLDDAPQHIAIMNDALTNDDTSCLNREAHRLKGSSASLGALRLNKLCQGIEDCARNGNVTDEAAVVLSQLNEEFQRVRAALESERGRSIS